MAQNSDGDYEQVTSDDVVQLANKYGIPPALALAFFQQESSGGQNTGKSSKGAVGPLQVMKPTFDAMNVGDDINDPMQATEAGVKYLAQAYRKNPNPAAVAAYYHAGPNWKQKLQENPNLGDGGIRTIDYAKSIAQKFAMLSGGQKAGGFTQVSDTSEAPATTGTVQNSDIQTATAPGKAKIPMPTENFGSFTVDSSDADGAAGTQIISATPTVVADKTDGDFDVESQIESLMETSSNIAGNIVTTSQDLSAKLKNNLQAQRDNLAKGGELAATVALEQFHEQEHKAGEHAAVLSKLGINTSDTDGIIASVVEEMQNDRRRLLDLNDAISRKKSTGLLPDPVGFFMDRMSVQGDVQEYNRIARNYNINEEFINNAAEEAAKINAVNAGKFTSTSLAGAKAAAELQRTVYDKKALEIDDRLSKVDLDTQIRTLQAVNAKISSLTNYQRAVDSKQIREDAAREKQRKVALAQAEDQRVQMAGRVLGIDINSVSELKRQRPDVKAAVSRIVANGGEEDGKIAATPLEAEQILATGNPLKMPFATQYMSKLLTSARHKAEQEVLGDQIAIQGKSKAEIVQMVNAKMFQGLNDFVQNPHKSVQYDGLAGMTNPFEAPRLEVMAKDPNAQKLKLVPLLQQFKKTAPGVEISDNMVMQIAYQNIGKVYSNISEAARDVSNYFAAATVRNNQIFKFSNFGLMDQKTYMGNSTVDLANYPSVLKEMLRVDAFRRGENPSGVSPMDITSRVGAKVKNKITDVLSGD